MYSLSSLPRRPQRWLSEHRSPPCPADARRASCFLSGLGSSQAPPSTPGPRTVGGRELAGASEVSHPEPGQFASTAHMSLSAVKCSGDRGDRGGARRGGEPSG